VFLFFHGGGWISGDAAGAGAYAEPFVARGGTFVAPDFSPVDRAGGDLNVLAEQVRRAVAWVWTNAPAFGADRDRLYVGGHSSGAHLCSLALVTDWLARGLPADAIKGGLCMSGMFELEPYRRSERRRYVRFTDTVVEELSSLRHVDRLRAPVVVTYGTDEGQDFQNQSRTFAAAIERAGKPVELIAATGYDHFEMGESLANPYGPNGRAALAMMRIDRA
jgi:arylformamidase